MHRAPTHDGSYRSSYRANISSDTALALAASAVCRDLNGENDSLMMDAPLAALPDELTRDSGLDPEPDTGLLMPPMGENTSLNSLGRSAGGLKHEIP